MEKLRAQGIYKAFDGKAVLGGASLTLNEGEIVSLLGASGCGKTTLFNVLSGLTPPDEGRVYLDGADVTGSPGRVGYMLQKDLLLPYRTIRDNVALPLLLNGMGRREARERAAAHFSEFGLEGCELLYPSELSGGMRQRAALLRTYLFGRDVTLLDEPFSALDPITKGAMHAWYLDVMQRIRLSTLFITHDMEEALLLSDRVLLMSGSPGRVTFELRIDEPRPRGAEFALSERFLEYKRELAGRL